MFVNWVVIGELIMDEIFLISLIYRNIECFYLFIVKIMKLEIECCVFFVLFKICFVV